MAHTCYLASDAHFGLHDRTAPVLFLHACRRAQPQTIALVGDMIDCAELHKSTYGRRIPSTDDGGSFTWQQEVVILKHFLSALRANCPDSRIVYLEGNHEHRLVKRVLESAPHLHGVTPPLPEYIGLESLGIEWIPCEETLAIGSTIVHHGWSASVYASRQNMLQLAESIVTGHTHRLRVIYQTGARGVVKYGMEIGCLCQRVASYMARPQPDWQQGFGILTEGSTPQVWFPAAVPIVHGRAIMPGKCLMVSNDSIDEFWRPVAAALASAETERYTRLVTKDGGRSCTKPQSI